MTTQNKTVAKTVAIKPRRERGLTWRGDRGSWYLRMWHNGKEIWRDLNTDQKPMAIIRAKDVRRQVGQEQWDLRMGLTKPEVNIPTVGEIVDLYLSVMKGPRPSPDSAKINANALLMVVRDGLGLKDKAAARKVSVSRLDQELAWAFQQARIEQMGGDPDEQASAGITIRSTLIKARAVFTENAAMHYRRAKWTVIAKLRCSHKNLPVSDTRYNPLSPETIEKMEAAALLLQAGSQREKQMYKGYLLGRSCALRAGEVIAAKWEWIEHTADGPCIAIIKRSDYTPKGTQGRVPMSASVLAELQALRGTSEYIIEGQSPSDRQNVIKYELSQWLRQFMPDRKDTTHTLRKHCISVVLTKTKSWPDAQRFARHSTSKITEQAYGHLLDPLQPVSREDWARQGAAAA